MTAIRGNDYHVVDDHAMLVYYNVLQRLTLTPFWRSHEFEELYL
jgi:hypothetical protein